MARRKSASANAGSEFATHGQPLSHEVSLADLRSRWDAVLCRWLRDALGRWYELNARKLPWRETQDPYRIWISEIMLQQTTVKAVIPFYERFLARFPTRQDLAAASESEVLQYWEGLGYYSRGRNLRLAAIAVQERFAGRFPESLAELQSLPGIGRYTAGAIRSFAFNQPAPIVEANTLRLYCRLLGYDGDPRSKAGHARLWDFAELIQPRKEAGHLNQALMELGAMVCTPNNPDCERCPLQRHCAAFLSGQQNEIPVRKARVEITATVEATIAIRDGRHTLVRQRQVGERWAGMWDFPRFPVTSITSEEKMNTQAFSRLREEVTRLLGVMVPVSFIEPEYVTEIFHSVTRYRIRLLCLTAVCFHSSADPRGSKISDHFRWATPEELASLPMPITGRQFATLLNSGHDGKLF